jgi:hypothetical protein
MTSWRVLLGKERRNEIFDGKRTVEAVREPYGGVPCAEIPGKDVLERLRSRAMNDTQST